MDIDLERFFDTYAVDATQGVVAAFSGGSDSLALLILLAGLVPSGRLVAVYVNHGIRSEAAHE
ncbi:MAG: ATP-binding protein, partial [Sphaerochaetaceae bacterium]